jgi:sugar phosphate isomerase/epimerase
MQRSEIGIEFISVLGLPPVQFVQLAQDLGCRHIGVALEPIVLAKGCASWSMRTDLALRQSMVDALRDSGVSVSLGEGFIAWPSKDIREARADLDAMRELGAQQVNLIALDPDRARTFDQCAVFAELAGERGMGATVEFMPGLPIGNLATAGAAIRHAGKTNLRVLIDAMHFFRSGSQVEELAAFDPVLIGHVQICDVPLISAGASYADEARYARLPPGAGELPLLEFLKALPEQVPMGVEVPMMARADAGVGARERLAPCLAGTWDLLKRAAAERR